MASETLVILDPTSPAKGADKKLAPRVSNLNGKVIGVLDNRWSAYDVFLPRIHDLFSETYHLSQFVRRTKSAKTSAAPAAMVEELAATCDLVINGLGA